MEDTVMISVSFKRYGWYGRNSNHAYHRFKDLYPEHRGDSASVNFVTCHDGFTLYDLYAYNTKHNEKTAGIIRMVITTETAGTVEQRERQMIRRSKDCVLEW